MPYVALLFVVCTCDVVVMACSHNTVIGAAGGSIQNAELAYAKKLL